MLQMEAALLLEMVKEGNIIANEHVLLLAA